jgi:hypothetical protein
MEFTLCESKQGNRRGRKEVPEGNRERSVREYERKRKSERDEEGYRKEQAFRTS